MPRIHIGRCDRYLGIFQLKDRIFFIRVCRQISILIRGEDFRTFRGKLLSVKKIQATFADIKQYPRLQGKTCSRTNPQTSIGFKLIVNFIQNLPCVILWHTKNSIRPFLDGIHTYILTFAENRVIEHRESSPRITSKFLKHQECSLLRRFIATTRQSSVFPGEQNLRQCHID